MTYRIPLPKGGRAQRLDLVDPFTTSIQRLIRQRGLASFEPETGAALLAVFEASDPGFVFYDVGANIGLYSSMAAAMFSPAAVHAFEPAPSTARVLASIARANGVDVTLHEFALSDVNGDAALFLSPVSDASNSLVPGFRAATEDVNVPIRRLDDLVDELGRPPTVVKIDVETHEAAVIAGAVRTLERHRPILVIEVLYRSDQDLGADIAEQLAGLGYSYYPLTSNPDWVPRERITGQTGGARDWLLTPEPLTADFASTWASWHDRYLECGVDRNARPPVVGSVRRALQRGGAREVLATANRFVTREFVPAIRSRTIEMARRVRSTPAIARTLNRLARQDYGRSSWLASRATSAFVGLDLPSTQERLASAEDLVDLFFDLNKMASIEVFVEAGAKDGGASRRAVSVPGRTVLAFEANPYTHRRFAPSFDATAVEYRHAALTDRSGPVEFLVRRDAEGGPQADGQGSLLERGDHTTGYERVRVDGVRLDSVSGDAGRIAMWVDVEGAVAPVLRGAAEIASRVDVMLIEVESRQRWEGQEWLIDDVVEHLAEWGLRPVARDTQSRRQFNVLFVRRGLVERTDVKERIGRWQRGAVTSATGG